MVQLADLPVAIIKKEVIMNFLRYTVTVFFVFVMVNIANATLRVVDGFGGGGKYAKLSEAVAAANVGDSIFIQPGIYTESQNVSISKRLVIYGNGYKGVGSSTNIQFQIDISSGANGTKISNIKFQSVTYGLTIQNVDYCVVSDCYFDNAQLNFATSSSDTVIHNIFITKNSSYQALYFTGTCASVVIANNIFSNGPNYSSTTYAIGSNGSMSQMKCFNNFFSRTTYPLYPSQGNSAYSIVGNIFAGTGSISAFASAATVYSGNWLYSVASNPTEPSNGEANGNGNPQFVRYDETQGFIFTGDESTDSDLRIQSSAQPFPNSPIDGSFPPVAPLGSGYVDALQQPGTINSNRADAGIFGGPLPFASIYAPAKIPSASSISITPAAVSPKGKIVIDVVGGFGSNAVLQTTAAGQQKDKLK